MEKLQTYEKYLAKLPFTGEVPAIIDFYAPWCGPCQMLAPRLELLAHQYHGRLKVFKVDVDKYPEFSTAAGIRSVPTLFFVNKNGDFDRVSGALSFSHMKTRVEDILKQ